MNVARIHRLVSVVVPFYNRQKFLERCLNSLAAQTYRPLEIIAVDDASTDDSLKIVRRWRRQQGALSKSDIRIIPLSRNRGYAGAMTIGMRAARGEYIALQDSDDYSSPNRLQAQIDFLRNHPRTGIVGTSYRSIKANGVISVIEPKWLRFGPERIRLKYAQGGHCVCVGTILVRGRLFDRYGGMNNRIVGAEDYEFIARYLSKGVLIDNIRRPLYLYQRHNGQRSREFYSRKS